MLIETLSMPLSKAFLFGNSQNTGFTPPLPQEARPSYTSAAVANQYDGVIQLGAGGEYTARRIFILPYAQAGPGDQFSMRVYGWHNVVQRGINDREWTAYPLIEVLCTVGDIPGPTDTTGIFGVGNTERYCDDITIVNGGVGWMGEIVTFGAGSGLVAWLMLDARAARLGMFDFAIVTAGIAANAMWAKA